MDLITNKDDLLQNIHLLDDYLSNKVDPSYDFALELIRKGVCFIALQGKNGMCFYPSRFVGYKNNTMDAHLSNEQKDGRDTTPQISAIINNKKPPKPDAILENLYVEYCTSLGLTASAKGAFGAERKYWVLET